MDRLLTALRRDGPFILFVRQVEKLLRPHGISPLSFTSHAGFQENVRQADLKEQFELIARDNLWQSAESVSGGGSELAYTAAYRGELVQLIRERKFQSFFDAPCGDFNWMPAVLAEVDVEYLGGDIAPTIVERNRRSNPGYQFVEFDITSDMFPAMDVWQCRDCMFHLSNELIWKSLENFVRSECEYALLTSHSGILRNVDINPGGWRYLDLTRAPFNFDPPEVALKDYRKGYDFPRHVGLWSRESIATFVSRRRS